MCNRFIRPIIRLRLISLCLVAVSLAVTLLGCDQPTSPPETRTELKVHQTRVVFPPEARALMIAAMERVNSKNLPLSSGFVVRLQVASYDDISSMDKVGTPEVPANLWIAPLTSLASNLKRPIQSETKIADCSSLMSTPLGAAYREIDAFAVPTEGGSLNLKSLLLPSSESSQRSPHIIAGAPRLTSSGIMAALLEASLSTGTPLKSLTPEIVTTKAGDIRLSQERIRNYFISDVDTLSWLNNRGSGEPLVVLTTEQSYILHRTYTPSTTLLFSRISSPAAPLDYPLCTISSKSDSPLDNEAAQALRQFFASDEFRSMASQFGFGPPAAASETSSSSTGAAAVKIIAEWPSLRRPSMTIFVVDSSIKADRATIETVRREIKMFMDSRASKDDQVALISASTNPEILAEPTASSEQLNVALTRLTTSGGNAIRDGIQTAFTLFSDLNSNQYRRAVVVFTSGKDTSSQTSASQLINRASQLVGRKNVDLFVLAFGARNETFGDLNSLTQQAGGSFVLTDIASLPGQFFSIARRIE